MGRWITALADRIVAPPTRGRHARRARRWPRRSGRRDDTVVIDLRGFVRSDDEVEAMLRHPSGRRQLLDASTSAKPVHD